MRKYMVKLKRGQYNETINYNYIISNLNFIYYYCKIFHMVESINPLKDIVFKYIFGREETADLHPEDIKEFTTDKYTVLDIKAKDAEGEVYKIEVQLTPGYEYKHRTFYY